MVFSINGWVEGKTTYTFINKTDNRTWTWFGMHIFWNDTWLLLFWNNGTIVKLLLKKTHWNINVFEYIYNSLILNHINSSGVIIPMYCCCPSVEYQCFHVAPNWLGFLDIFVNESCLTTSWVRVYRRLHLYFTACSVALWG